MALSSWNLTSLRMKIGCLSYCWDNSDCSGRDYLLWVRPPALREYSQQSMGCKQKGRLCVLAGTCPRLPRCSPRGSWSTAACRTRISACSDGCSIGGRTADHHPWLGWMDAVEIAWVLPSNDRVRSSMPNGKFNLLNARKNNSASAFSFCVFKTSLRLNLEWEGGRMLRWVFATQKW